MKVFKHILFLLIITLFVNLVIAADEVLPVLPLTACAITNNDIRSINSTGFNLPSYPADNHDLSVLNAALESKRKANGELESVVTKFNSVSTLDRYIFQGKFRSLDNSLVIAVLSDDGVEVTIDDTIVKFNNFDHGQALPNLNNSLKVIEGVWKINDVNPHTIKIKYSNICYTGKDDIDGLTVFFCGGVNIIPPINEEPIPVTVSLSFAKEWYLSDEITPTTATANIVYTGSGVFTKNWSVFLYKDGVIIPNIAAQTASYVNGQNSCSVTFTGINIISGNYTVKVDKGEQNYITSLVYPLKLIQLDIVVEGDGIITVDGANKQICEGYLGEINKPTPVYITFNSYYKDGILTLSSTGLEHIRVWNDFAKINQIMLPKKWDTNIDSIPVKLYIEGVDQSITDEIIFKLSYTINGDTIEKTTLPVTIQ
jgi:hypothetical protein